MDKRECVKLLLEHGADPRIASESHEAPESVSPADELKALLQGWDVAHTDKLLAEREKRNAKQWQPPPHWAETVRPTAVLVPAPLFSHSTTSSSQEQD
jgi:hypothetical protein